MTRRIGMLRTRILVGTSISAGVSLLLLADHYLENKLPVDLVTISVTAIALLGIKEFFQLCRRHQLAPFESWTLAWVVILGMSEWWQRQATTSGQSFPAPRELALVLFLLGLLGLQLGLRRPRGLLNLAVTVFGLAYVWLLLSFTLRIRYLAGVPGVLLFIAVVKVADVSAYLVGRKLGRHKLAPSLSPAKSIEGAVASLATSVVVSCIVGVVWFRMLDWLGAVIFGMVVGVVAQGGDFVESMFKRESCLKDSGELLPSYGGVLDILDSLLPAAPVAYLLLLTLGKG